MQQQGKQQPVSTGSEGGLRDLWTAMNGCVQAVNALTQQIATSKMNFASVLAASGPSTISAATYVVLASDTSLIANGTGLALTLPAPGTNNGRLLFLKNIVAFTITSGSANVVPLAGGAAGTAIVAATAGKWAILQSDGTHWQIMAAN